MKEKLLPLLLPCGDSLEDVGDAVCTATLGTGVCWGQRVAEAELLWVAGHSARLSPEPTAGRDEGHSTRLSPPQGSALLGETRAQPQLCPAERPLLDHFPFRVPGSPIAKGREDLVLLHVVFLRL